MRLAHEGFGGAGLTPEQLEEMRAQERDRKQRALIRRCEDQKNAITEFVDNLQPTVDKMQHEQKSDIVRKFNSQIMKLKKDFEQRKLNKDDQEGDLKERETEMQHELELITSMAQRIDNENRQLIRKNNELKQNFKGQEVDREKLVRELVEQKAKNKTMKAEIEEFKSIIAEKQGLEEQVDIDFKDEPLPDISGANATGMIPPMPNLPKVLEADDVKLQRYERVID